MKKSMTIGFSVAIIMLLSCLMYFLQIRSRERWVSYVFERTPEHLRVKHPVASLRLYPWEAAYCDENLEERK